MTRDVTRDTDRFVRRACMRRATYLGLILALVCLALPLDLQADDTELTPNWGVMGRLELGRNYLPEDPGAAASVVFDKGDIIVGPGYDFALRRHCRLQIFSPAGYKHATVKIPYRDGERVFNLEAHTLTPDGRRIKVPKDRVYKIENGQWQSLIFAFPEVTAGSVVEYRYEMSSQDFYYLRPWVFQTDIPTEFSQLKVHLPPGFEYAAVINGYDHVDPVSTDEYYSAEHDNTRVHTYCWTARDLPALQPLPYLFNLEDHRVRLDFQIIRYRSQDIDRIFIESWDDLIARVRGWYDDLTGLPSSARDEALQVAAGITDPRLYAERAYQFCRDSVAFAVGGKAVSAEDLRSAEEVLQNRRGNGVEKNLLLIALLRWAGLNADPVLISTLDHLRFDHRDHRLDQFNHILVRWTGDDGVYYLDAADPAIWFGALPPLSAVDRGIWIGRDDEEGGIVTLPPTVTDNAAEVTAELWVKDDGSVHGKLTGSLHGYRTWDWARENAAINLTDYLKTHWCSPGWDIQVQSAKAPLRSESGSLTFTVEFTCADAITVGAHTLYFRPTEIFGIQGNPFLNPEREYPVSFAYPYREQTRTIWHVPQDFKFADVPLGGSATADGLEFTSVVSSDERSLTIERELRINQQHFPSTAYGTLQQFFESVVEIDRGLAVGVHTTTSYSDRGSH